MRCTLDKGLLHGADDRIAHDATVQKTPPAVVAAPTRVPASHIVMPM